MTQTLYAHMNKRKRIFLIKKKKKHEPLIQSRPEGIEGCFQDSVMADLFLIYLYH
jgi:hypothetical protein